MSLYEGSNLLASSFGVKFEGGIGELTSLPPTIRVDYGRVLPPTARHYSLYTTNAYAHEISSRRFLSPWSNSSPPKLQLLIASLRAIQ